MKIIYWILGILVVGLAVFFFIVPMIQLKRVMALIHDEAHKKGQKIDLAETQAALSKLSKKDLMIFKNYVSAKVNDFPEVAEMYFKELDGENIFEKVKFPDSLDRIIRVSPVKENI